MSMRLSFVRNLVLPSSLLAASGCAVATPAPRFTAVSPADPAAAESTLPPPAPMLTGAGELAEPPAAPTAGPEGNPPGHEGHGPATAGAAFTCTMHPEVAAREPGKCPLCGMTLIEKAAPKEHR